MAKYMMKHLMVAVILVAGSMTQAALADLNGQWEADMATVNMYIDKQDQGMAPCKSVQVGLQVSPDALQMTGFHMECGAMLIMDIDPQSFQLKDGAVLNAEGQKVGTIGSDGGSVEFSMNDGRVTRYMEFLQTPKTTRFLYLWSDGFTTLVVRGVMSPK